MHIFIDKKRFVTDLLKVLRCTQKFSKFSVAHCGLHQRMNIIWIRTGKLFKSLDNGQVRPWEWLPLVYATGVNG